MVGVTHSVTTGEPNNPAYDVSATAWNAEHLIADNSISVMKLTSIAATLTADVTAVGIKITGTAGENLAFGNLTYLKSDGKFWKTDANAEATTKGLLAMAIATISASNSGLFLLFGMARNDAWGWTVGSPLFVSETPGEFTHTAPSDAGDFVRLAGVGGQTGDYLYFNGMNLDWGEV